MDMSGIAFNARRRSINAISVSVNLLIPTT